ncbi:MAG: MBL fold metallo-hydrolase [Gammaproteobacteria bacterium]|nr:MBL fold metallo-hydrolase [Gammaproteobacteria bacterium]
MHNSWVPYWVLLIVLLACNVAWANDDHKNKLAVNKVKGSLSVMVLGSGGPVATAAGRASAAYLIFVDGQPKILMDAGGGAYTRLAESGTNIKDLDIVLLTHLHIDHTGDLSSIMKTAYFHSRGYNLANNAFPPGRTAPFRIFGPAANGAKFPPVLNANPDTTQYPASSEYVHHHYDLNSGMERYLNIFSRAISGGIFKYETTDVSPNWQAYNPEVIVNENGLKITAVGVNHGPVPALAFRIDYKGHSIVYSGDTSTKGNNMIALSEGADLLIYDTAIMDDLPNGANDAVFFALHTTPSRMGEVAAQVGVKTLVLSHITPITESRLKQVKQLITAKSFRGSVKVAKDLKVYNLTDD